MSSNAHAAAYSEMFDDLVYIRAFLAYTKSTYDAVGTNDILNLTSYSM